MEDLEKIEATFSKLTPTKLSRAECSLRIAESKRGTIGDYIGACVSAIHHGHKDLVQPALEQCWAERVAELEKENNELQDALHACGGG